MDKSFNTERNEAADKGKNNDPALRDDSAIQPGVQTISGGERGDAQLTRTNSEIKDGDKNADPRFDEVDQN